MLLNHFSAVTNTAESGHAHFDFVDIKMNSDTKLFIDPSVIKVSKDPWCIEANRIIDSYFDKFYAAYRSGGDDEIRKLLIHAQEVPDTHLGYGGTFIGHGNTADGLMDKFSCLKTFITKIDSISTASDLPVLIPNFDKDGLSDMITNIIRLQLYNFTKEQMMLLGKPPDSTCSFYTWDVVRGDWAFIESAPSYTFGGRNVLLVPKRIVQKHYLYRAEHFFRQIILERMKQDAAYTDSSGKTQYPYKKELEAQINKPTETWKHDFIIDYAAQFPNTLLEYHKRTPEFYSGRTMTDEELDSTVYGNNIHS